jgi:tyrosine-protein kinase Etk/Wzc
MNDERSSTKTPQLTPARKAWVEAMVVLLRHKMLIVITTIVVTVTAAVYYFTIAPVWYKGEANILPALRASGLLDNLATGFSSTIKDLGLTKIAGKSKSDNIYSPLALGMSKTVQTELVKEFNMEKVYDAKSMADAVKEFSEHASVDVLEEGNIGVSFEDTDPKRAAAITNRLVAKLNEVNSKLAMEEARFNRTYIERRYSQLIASVDSADRALGEFQRKYGVYELKSQAQAQLSVLSTLEQQRYFSEIQQANAEQLYGVQSPEANALHTQLTQIQGKLQDLKTGMDQQAKSYFVPTDVMPDVALQYLQLTREVEIQSKLKAFLLPSVEQARLDETKQSLAYLVLDSAQVPEKKSRPKRATSVLVAMLGALALSSIGVLAAVRFKEGQKRFRQDRNTLGL